MTVRVLRAKVLLKSSTIDNSPLAIAKCWAILEKAGSAMLMDVHSIPRRGWIRSSTSMRSEALSDGSGRFAATVKRATPHRDDSVHRRDETKVKDDWLRRIGPASFSHVDCRCTRKFDV